MLVLTRKSGESIRVGDGIIFTILDGTGGPVKVGVTAPPHWPIHREEVYRRIRRSNLASAKIRHRMEDWFQKMGPPEGSRRKHPQ